MNAREHLRQAISGLPDGGAVMLPVEEIRRWLREDLEERGDLPGSQRVLSTTEVAERMNVQSSTVAEWCQQGRFPNAWKTGSDGGGEWRIPESDLLAFTNGPKDGGRDRVRFE